MVEIVDNSRLESVAKCSTMAVMRYVLDYTSKAERADAKAGTACHKAFKEYFENGGKGKALKAFEDVYAPFCVANPPQDERLSYQNVRDVLENWLTIHDGKAWPFEPIAGELEKGCKVELCEGIEFFALIDMPVELREGGFGVCDHKTTGRINDWWLRKFRLASQLTGYAWALGTAKGVNVERVFVNVMELPKLPEPSAKKCRTHGVAYEECRKKHGGYQLAVMSRSEETKQRWLQDAKLMALKFKALGAFTDIEMVRWLPMEGAFNNSCTFCEFVDFCRADRAPQIAEGSYVKSRWAPWEGGNDGE